MRKFGQDFDTVNNIARNKSERKKLQVNICYYGVNNMATKMKIDETSHTIHIRRAFLSLFSLL